METPPRAWGRRKPSCHTIFCARNTPTCVGKTQARKRAGYDKKKHPHVRGEDTGPGPWPWPPQGTPPRAWGRRTHRGLARKGRGNTPTCVGKTAGFAAFALLRAGTPPRAWGRPEGIKGRAVDRGNTPTCVGKTLRDYSLFLLSRQNNIETSSFSDTSCSPDNSMSWRFGSPMP